MNRDFVFRSDFYEIKFWNQDSSESSVTGWNENFCITYVHGGNLRFNLFRSEYDLHTGCILLDKPNYAYQVLPAKGQCTVIRIYPDFYQTLLEDTGYKNIFFISNKNLLSLSLKSSPAIDYLHFKIFEGRFVLQQLEMDILVMELLHRLIAIIDCGSMNKTKEGDLNKSHFLAIEKAKEYICSNFSKNISLNAIARYACISPFHFNRIFKKFTSFSPYQYLLNIRMAHGVFLLKNSNLPVSEIARDSGFKTQEYFATSFKQKFDNTPVDYRKIIRGIN